MESLPSSPSASSEKPYEMSSTLVTDGGSKVVPDRKHNEDIVLHPQPSDSRDDPLNWPLRKKILIFGSVLFAAFVAQMSPNSNQLTFVLQEKVYHKNTPQMLNTVAAALAGWVAGPFFIIPLAAIFGRASVIFWSLIGIFCCQIWAAKMTGSGDYISFLLSRLFAGFFGAIPAILGSGYILDLFFLHQRGKAFAIFEVFIILAVVGGGTLSGFVAEKQMWNYVFWWTLGPIGAAIIAVYFFVEDTTFDRKRGVLGRAPLPTNFFANRFKTFLPGVATQPSGKLSPWWRATIIPLQICFAPITILAGTYIFIVLGLPIMQASTLATYVMPPVAHGGYGFSPLQIACFTFTAWIGMIAAQLYGYLFNDVTPLWLARRRGGTWHPEYRLANTLLPSILMPIALGLYGAGLQYHLHIMVLALGSFLIWFSALLALPVCYNYVVECFLHHPVEASVALNAYRVSFGLMSVFTITDWQKSVGVGWMWGMGAFLIVFVDLIMIGIVFKGHVVRNWTVKLNPDIAVTEDGAKVTTHLGQEGQI